MNWLEDQPLDELAPQAIPDAIARWCFNSADQGSISHAGTHKSCAPRAPDCASGRGARPSAARARRRRSRHGDHRPVHRLRSLAQSSRFAAGTPSRCVSSRADRRPPVPRLHARPDRRDPAPGGAGTLAGDDSATSTEILAVTFKDSVDGTTRTYDVVPAPRSRRSTCIIGSGPSARRAIRSTS
jgi:hypothetical protein